MKDRIKLNNKKSRITKFHIPDTVSTVAELVTLMSDGIYNDSDANNATTGDDVGVSVIGTPMNKTNLDPMTFTTFTHTKTGTNHELTNVDGGVNIRFIATADYAAGDTFTMNGESITGKMPDGSALARNFFTSGSPVISLLVGTDLVFVGGANMEAQLVITLTASDNASLVGQSVTVKSVDTSTVIETFLYDGQPHTTPVPVGTNYSVTAAEKATYVVPPVVTGTAAFNSVVNINIAYQLGYRYGYKRAKNNSSPTGRITYLHNAVGMTPAAMNFATGVFNEGTWGDFINAVCKPFMVKYDGTEDYELSHTDQTKKIDGATSSDITNANYGGNAMAKFTNAFPWVHRSQDADYEYVIFSNIQFDSTYHAYAHTNEAGVVQDAFYWGMYDGSNVSSKLRSIAGRAVMVSQTAQTEVSYAQANGSGWYTIYKSGWEYIADLLTLISKSDDSQTAFGAGRSASGNSAGITPGSLKDKGAFMGYTDGTSSVKVFYIEDFWGNYWQRMAGLILNGTIKNKNVPPYNFDGATYNDTAVTPTVTSGGFIDTADVTEANGFIPKTANGSGSTYYCDGLYFNTPQVDYALVGGNWDYALRCGCRFVDLNYLASSAGASIGSRISYINPSAA